jgi:hypothetical protein
LRPFVLNAAGAALLRAAPALDALTKLAQQSLKRWLLSDAAIWCSRTCLAADLSRRSRPWLARERLLIVVSARPGWPAPQAIADGDAEHAGWRWPAPGCATTDFNDFGLRLACTARARLHWLEDETLATGSRSTGPTPWPVAEMAASRQRLRAPPVALKRIALVHHVFEGAGPSCTRAQRIALAFASVQGCFTCGLRPASVCRRQEVGPPRRT